MFQTALLREHLEDTNAAILEDLDGSFDALHRREVKGMCDCMIRNGGT